MHKQLSPCTFSL
uniref:Uncharacterized protein n=1 Tax=Anguilla anguilla TaxID=7936 RepID=A0A0E9TAJ2_ANGAN